MAMKLSTQSVVSMPVQEAVIPQLDLSLGDYNVDGGSIRCSGGGIEFAFNIWPQPDATVAALAARVLHHGWICLLLPQRLLLDLVAVERKEQQRVRIAGRIVGSASDDIRTIFSDGACR
jgi:hypothetical protein